MEVEKGDINFQGTLGKPESACVFVHVYACAQACTGVYLKLRKE